MVGRHEDDEEELRLEALGEPERRLHLLLRGAAHQVEIDPAVPERVAVVELERAEALAQLGIERRRRGHALLAEGGVHAGDREAAVELGRRPAERDVDDAGAAAGRGQPVPERRRAPVAAVDQPQPVAGRVALGEVPDPVAPGVDAGDHRRPRVRRQRVRRRAQDAARAALEQAGEMREVAALDQGIDDVERRRVESDHGERGPSHAGWIVGARLETRRIVVTLRARRRGIYQEDEPPSERLHAQSAALLVGHRDRPRSRAGRRPSSTVYNVDFSSSPPSLTERTKPSYSAQGRLLVTDRASRISATRSRTCRRSPPTPTARRASFRSRPRPTRPRSCRRRTSIRRSSSPTRSPRSARRSSARTTAGSSAQALYAVPSPSRFAPSRVPVIQLIAVADTPKKAIDLVTHTSTAFIRWMRAEPAARRGSSRQAADHGRRAPDAEGRRRVRRRLIDAAGARLRRRADGVRRARPPLRPDVPAAARGGGSGDRDGARAGADERMTCTHR